VFEAICVRRHKSCFEAHDVNLCWIAFIVDLGGSSIYSNEILKVEEEKGSMWILIGHGLDGPKRWSWFF
jgi:hypothetical protein